MRLRNKVLLTFIGVSSCLVLFFSITGSKQIHITNNTACKVEVKKITTESGTTVLITSNFDPLLKEFQILEIRHFLKQKDFYFDLEIDGEPHKFLYDSYKQSFHPEGDSATPDWGRISLVITNIPCKL